MSTHVTDPGPTSSHRLLVLISGTGSNLQALIDACQASSDPSTRSQSNTYLTLLPHTSIVRVISNRKDAYGLERARAANIPTTYHNLVQYKKKQPSTPEGVIAAREDYDAELARLIIQDAPDLVVCAGFMHILSPQFLDPLAAASPPIPAINLHPALPGQFNGTDAIGRAWNAFQRGEIEETGVMIHRVVAEVDMGEPLVVRKVEMKIGESEYDLEQRIHKIEWETIVEGTRKALEAFHRPTTGKG